MSPSRKLLITGLPVGLGATMAARGLGDALHDLRRRVCILTGLADCPGLKGAQQTVTRRAGGLVFRNLRGPDFVPLETLEAADEAEALRTIDPDCEFLIIDRFTGLNVRQSSLYDLADEVLLMVDGRPGQSARSLILLSHILNRRPGLPVYALINHLTAGQGWQAAAQSFNNRCRRHLGRQVLILGGIDSAPEIARAQREQQSPVRMYPNHPASRMLRQVARHLLHVETTWAHRSDLLIYAPHRAAEKESKHA